MSARLASLLLAAAGLCSPAAGRAVAQGTVTVALPEPLSIFSDLFTVYYPTDLHGDALINFTFSAEAGFVGLRTERANRVMVRPSPPPNIGGPVAKLDSGFQVGSSLDPQLAWISSDPLGGYVSRGENAFAPIAIHLSDGTSSEWPDSPGARGFIGIQFELADGFHYGHFDVHMAAEGGGWLYGWAYNSIPYTPILASPVPEPSTWALLVGGAVLMVWMKPERNEKRG